MRSTNARGRPRGLPRRTRARNPRRVVVAMNSLARAAGPPDAGERVPAVPGQGAGADQNGAREPVGVGRRPAQAPRAAEVVGDQVGALDAQLVERPADEGRVVGDRLRKALGLRPAEPGSVPRHRPQAPAGDGEQRLPVGARARVAVQEHDGLGGVGAARPRAAGCARRQRAARAAGRPRPGSRQRGRARPAQHPAGDRGPQERAGGGSRMPTTAMKAPATSGSPSAVACSRRM